MAVARLLASTGRTATVARRSTLQQRRHAATLKLLTSASCSLCEDMLDTLDAVRREEAFELEEIDIRSEAVSHQLRRRFQYSIPVLMDGDTVVAQTRLRADRLIEYLRERRKREVRKSPACRTDATRPWPRTARAKPAPCTSYQQRRSSDQARRR